MSDGTGTCAWCSEQLPPRAGRVYCPRPRLCRDRAYRSRKRATAAVPERGALAACGHQLQTYLDDVREILLDAVLYSDPFPGVFASAAAGVETRANQLVLVAVLEERRVGATWAQIGEPFGLSADAARKRWGRYELRDRPTPPG